MKLLYVLFFCFLSDPAVCVKHNIWSAAEGGNATLHCHLTLPGSTKFFCKEKCVKTEDILIKTDGTTAQSGRWSIKYKNGSTERGIISVSFTNMTKSDSGMYRCGLGKSEAPDSFSDFEVRVSNELEEKSGFTRTETEGGEITMGCIDAVYRQRIFLCKNKCKKEGEILIDTTSNKAQNGRYSIEYKAGSAFGLYVTITQLTKSDTGHYTCGYGNPLSPDSHYSEDVVVIDASKSAASTAQPTTQSQSFTSTISTPSSVYAQPGSRSWDRASHSPGSTPQSSSDCPDFFFPLAVCASLAGVLLLSVFLLLLYICKTKRNTVLNIRENDYTNMKFSAIRDD